MQWHNQQKKRISEPTSKPKQSDHPCRKQWHRKGEVLKEGFYRAILSFRGGWIHKIPFTWESILPGFKWSTCGRTAVIKISQHPMRNWWQLQAWVRGDDSEKWLIVCKQQWRLKKKLAYMRLSICFIWTGEYFFIERKQRTALKAFLDGKYVFALSQLRHMVRYSDWLIDPENETTTDSTSISKCTKTKKLFWSAWLNWTQLTIKTLRRLYSVWKPLPVALML